MKANNVPQTVIVGDTTPNAFYPYAGQTGISFSNFAVPNKVGGFNT